MTKRKRKRVHTAKFDRCVRDLSRRGGVKNPDAVCMASLGEKRAVLKKSRRKRRAKNPKPASAWVIYGKKNGSRPLFYDGMRLAAGRAQAAVKFPTRGAASSFARSLKRQYRRPLSGVRLKVSGV